jgi:hypothetical protein
MLITTGRIPEGPVILRQIDIETFSESDTEKFLPREDVGYWLIKCGVRSA